VTSDPLGGFNIVEIAGQEDPPPDVVSWWPVDLSGYLDGSHKPAVPTLLARTDGVCLLYPGLVHSLHGESESGKSLVAQHLAAEQIMAGQAVLFIDFESDAATVTERLLMLGATPEVISQNFSYIRPEVAPQALAESHAWQVMLSRSYILAVIDRVTDSLGVFGYSTKDNDDVAKWMRVLPKNIAARTGGAVAVIDHVTKDGDSRGRFAIGAQAKMSGLTGAGYTVEVAEALGRGRRGVIVLRVGKDRPGHVRGESGPMRKSDRTQETARITVDSTEDRDHPLVTVEPWRGSDGRGIEARPFRPTGLMEKISQALEATSGSMSGRGVLTLVSGKKEHIIFALDTLVTEGYVIRVDGPHRSQMHTSAKAYRQEADPASDRYLGAGGTEPPQATKNLCSVPPVPIPGDEGHSLDRPRGVTRGSLGVTEICGICHSQEALSGRGICSPCTTAANAGVVAFCDRHPG